jgi:NADH-quinone oxidoreductase subunit L
VADFTWFEFGNAALRVSWILDPLAAVLLVMVSFVGLLIFIYSVGYMAHDENFTRFFCFLSLFAAAMLGVVIANSLLLLFICWELVGLASYLLIGFWYQRPSAAAAAKKAFITTRLGDLGLFLGMLWLYADTGTLLFYDNGAGCLEPSALMKLVGQTTAIGVATSTAIALLIFCGAVGKSGQVPLHVWLPDAMEGPTPVSALIHAATMVAAGVFLVARVFPLMSAAPAGSASEVTAALQVVTWTGVVTAVFAALIAVAQTDIKRILAYSTVSQLGYMMMGLGVGGVAVGMFHLLTHAVFKALLFLGAGSVIHGCHEEQDIRRLGGLRRAMPATFATYAVGMMALAGVPLVFSGFWSKDEILHAAHAWPVSHGPFYLGLVGALLTAFYMTRQMCYVFFGKPRQAARSPAFRLPGAPQPAEACTTNQPGCPAPTRVSASVEPPHESPPVMVVPLVVLAVCVVLMSLFSTPAWPWLHGYLTGHPTHFEFGKLLQGDVLQVMALSTAAVAIGIGLAAWLYGRKPITQADAPDALEQLEPDLFTLLRGKFFVDEFYEATVIRLHAWLGRACRFLDEFVWSGLVAGVTYLMLGLSWLSRMVDEFVVDRGFDGSCRAIGRSGRELSWWHNGQVQRYLRVLGLALAVLVIVFVWGLGK